ncbi:MAG: hypothetical protein DRR08_11620 [Candidatus Parabeggiatoa sp. nov. 2]|nr:MAG: hypothetical protein B6247_06655 [Beggiatoa sp. 4572_84]RKZ60318.1 MAG: hypothetical protein DRR08_11620 [Gammaproteobacteria bacterium]
MIVQAKLSFDSSLNVVDKAFAIEAGRILADNPIGFAFYARLQRQGTDILFINDPNMAEMGFFYAPINLLTVNMLYHSSAQEVVSTMVHEATHQNGFFRGLPYQHTQFSEYQAFRNELFFENGKRPSLEARFNLWNTIQEKLYPHLPQGKYPFGDIK